MKSLCISSFRSRSAMSLCFEANELGLTEDKAVDEAGVVFTVREDDVLAVTDAPTDPEFDMKPVDHSSTDSFPRKVANSSSSWLCRIQGPVQHATTSTSCAESLERILGRSDDLRMVSQSQVVV